MSGIHQSVALMFSLICAWRSAWANNRDTGDWVRHRTNYDVTVMSRNVLYFDRTRYSWRYEWINISPGIYNMLTSCWQLYCKANRSWAKENTIQQIKTFTADILFWHRRDIIMSTVASQITGVSIVCLTACSGAEQRKYQSSAWLAFVRGIHRWPVDSPHKGPVTQKNYFIWWRHHGISPWGKRKHYPAN